jgi:hypothetical protein
MIQLLRRALTIVPPLSEDLLKRYYPLVLASTHWRMPVERLHGTAKVSGQPSTILVAGEEAGVGYLASCFFVADPRREPMGSFPLWTLERRLSLFGVGADMTIIRADRVSAAVYFRRRYLAVPAWLDMIVRLPTDLEILIRASRDVKEDMRNIKRAKFDLRISTQEQDFDFFYHALYLPYMRQRHGASAHIRDSNWLRRCFRHGAILWISRGGRPHAAALVEQRKRVLCSRAIGVLDGNFEMLREGAVAAAYYHVIKFAYQRGCAWVDFGAVRPSLNDGLTRFKRKWGSELADLRRYHYFYLVQLNRWNPSVAGFLSEHPLIYRNRNNRFSALAALISDQPASEEEAARARHLLWTEGLDNLDIVSTSGWEAGARAPAQTAMLTCPYGDQSRIIEMIG